MKLFCKIIIRLISWPSVIIVPYVGSLIVVLLFIVHYPINMFLQILEGDTYKERNLPYMFLDWYDDFCEKWKNAL